MGVCGRRKAAPNPARSRPPPPPPPSLPKCKAIYPYEAQDTDELTFSVGDIIEIVKKGLQYLYDVKHNVSLPLTHLLVLQMTVAGGLVVFMPEKACFLTTTLN